MSRQWIVTISEDNLQPTLKHKLLGFSQRRANLAKKVRPGDKVVLYIGKKRAGYGGPQASVSQLGPVVQVTGEEIFSDTPIWNSRTGEVFPGRIPISPVMDGKISAAKVIPQLNFVRSKDKWGLYFLTAIREISEEDYNILLAAITKVRKPNE